MRREVSRGFQKVLEDSEGQVIIWQEELLALVWVCLSDFHGVSIGGQVTIPYILESICGGTEK